MSERDPTVESHPNERKFFGKHKWRGKLFSSEEKISKSQEGPGQPTDDLQDFLQKSDRKHAGNQHDGHYQPDAGSPESKWPSASMVEHVTSNNAASGRRKVPRQQGLRVTFTSAPPDIIGEGGDEAELPATDVAKSRESAILLGYSQAPAARQQSRGSSPPPRVDPAPSQDPKHVSQDDEDTYVAPPLRRQSTGFHALDNDHQHQAMKDGDISVNQADIRNCSASSPDSGGDSEDFAAIYAEYTKASPLSSRDATDRSHFQLSSDRLKHKGDIGDLRGQSSLKPISPDFDPSFGNSLTPIPSPEPIEKQDPPLLGPRPLRSACTDKSMSSSRAFESSDQNDKGAGRPSVVSPSSDPAVTTPPFSDSPVNNPPAKAPALSLRTVAKNLGGDALNDFISRVQRFYGIFRLGACANRNLKDVSFERWTMAAAWWFLNGRAALENAVRGRPKGRDRPPSGDVGDSVTALKQAYMNLAKASWIAVEIAPNHDEIRKFGAGSMNSLLAIVENFGDAKLVALIEVHVAITASLRALTMSMKRNNKMPSTDFEAQGIDSRIWIETPRLGSGTASLLAGASSRNLLEDTSTTEFASFFPCPVGDTNRHFNYGSMFVDVVLKSSDKTQERVHIPCIASMLRQRNTRDLTLTLASPDRQLNIVVQSGKGAGPTWRDVHWEPDSFCVTIGLSSSFDVEIRFIENNFHSLWALYDKTRQIRKNMEATGTEENVFKSRVKCAHFVDSPDSKVFPPDPVLQCDVGLFQRSRTLVEGSGRRKFHDGHRLIIVTPPNSKVLSNVNLNLGKQSPILFSYVRGEGNGPAILLNPDAVGPTLVITFNSAAERESLHSQLDGTFLRNDESCTEAIPLQSLRICEATEDATTVESGDFLNNRQWKQIRVYNKRHEYIEHGVI